MGCQREFFSPLHARTERDVLERMKDHKVECMRVARRFDKDFFDGERRYGFGGYHYDGRWFPLAQELARTYALNEGARILEVGCGKGFLLYELKRAVSGCMVQGFDISSYAIEHAKDEIRECVSVKRAEDTPWSYGDKEFDLVISLTTLHNLPIFDIKNVLQEIERVGRQAYICLDSYRNEAELFGLQCWALTAESFFSEKEWKWIFKEFSYSGDYEFIHFLPANKDC